MQEHVHISSARKHEQLFPFTELINTNIVCHWNEWKKAILLRILSSLYYFILLAGNVETR